MTQRGPCHFKIFITSSPFKGDTSPPHGAAWEAPVWSGGRRSKPGPALFSEGKARQDRVNRLGLAGLNNSGKLWEGVVPRCQVPGLGLIQGRENIRLLYEGLIKEMAG